MSMAQSECLTYFIIPSGFYLELKVEYIDMYVCSSHQNSFHNMINAMLENLLFPRPGVLGVGCLCQVTRWGAGDTGDTQGLTMEQEMI